MLTKYGLRELFIFGGTSAILSAGSVVTALNAPNTWLEISAWVVASLSLLLLIITLNFFRDPERTPPEGEKLMVSPADGIVSDIEVVDEPHFIKGKAVRVGIFMNVFNVHVNRNPTNGKVCFLEHEPGKFLAVFDAAAAAQNEKFWTGIENTTLNLKFTVCQVAGLLARRIVCDLKEEDTVERGKRFGMIKFGSRLELYIPEETAHTVKVKIGEKAVAGETVLIELS